MPHLAIVNRTPPAQPAAVVRAAALDEHAAIADLLLRANIEYRKILPAAIYDDYIRGLRGLTASWSDKDFLIAESDGRLLGAVAFYCDASCIGGDLPPEWAGLRALAVDPRARGRGIGRQLAETCVLRAWRIGRQMLCLHNAGFQHAARTLYLAIGFQRCPQYDFTVADPPGRDHTGERLVIDAFCLNLRR